VNGWTSYLIGELVDQQIN